MPIIEKDPWRTQYFTSVSCPDNVFIPTDDELAYQQLTGNRGRWAGLGYDLVTAATVDVFLLIALLFGVVAFVVIRLAVPCLLWWFSFPIGTATFWPFVILPAGHAAAVEAASFLSPRLE